LARPPRALCTCCCSRSAVDQADNAFQRRVRQGAPQTFIRSLSDWAAPEVEGRRAPRAGGAVPLVQSGKQYGYFHLAELTLPLDASRAPTTLGLPTIRTWKIWQ